LPAPAPAPTATLAPDHALLPPVLTGPASFLWFWTLPIGLLLALNLQSYRLIEGNLDASGHRSAIYLGLLLAGSLLLSLGLFVAARRRASATTPAGAWALPAIVTHVAYLWLATESSGELLPRSVSAWIYPEARYFFHQFALAMLPLFHGVLRLACAGVDARGSAKKSIVRSFGLALGMPVLAYLAALALTSFGRFERLAAGAAALVFVAGGVVLFVCLLRAVLLLLRSVARGGPAGERAAIAVLALVLPLAGLWLNASIAFPVDFQAPEVYALTVLNAGLLLTGSLLLPRRPRLALALLAVTFPFALYFFVVFLPYLPLALVAMIALGAGFLILAPTLLFALHLHLLWRAARAVNASGLGARRVGALVAAGIALLPAAFVARALGDRHALNAALDYAYTPALGVEAPRFSGDRAHVVRALANHRAYKAGRYYPLLSEAYAAIVFGGLVLPDAKLAQLETLFGGRPGRSSAADGLGLFHSRGNRPSMPRAVPPPRHVAVSALEVSARAVSPETTSVTLALTLQNPGPADAEYSAALPLPSGLLVHGFRLHVHGRPVPGRLVEKKTALWVYTMIRDTERRDPGLLFHRAPGELELRVFPVVAGTPSIVEIDFLVPAAAQGFVPRAEGFDPAATVAALARAAGPALVRTSAADLVASGLDRAGLPAAAQPIYLHLLLERSLANAFGGAPAATLRALRERFPAATHARASLVDLDVRPLVPDLTPLDELPGLLAPALERAAPPAGGFNLDAALAHALRLHRDHDLDRRPAEASAPPPGRPVFVILGARASSRGPFDLPLAEAWADCVSGFELHEIGADGSFATHRAASVPTPLVRAGSALRPVPPGRLVRFPAPPGATAEGGAAPATGLAFWDASARAWRRLPGLVREADPVDAPWPAALALQLRHQDRARDPGGRASPALATLLTEAGAAGVLIPAASYIVVESAAQWRALEAAEARKLGQHEALDHLEAPAPAAWWVLAGFLVVQTLRRPRRPAPRAPRPGPRAPRPVSALTACPALTVRPARSRAYPGPIADLE
jgi:hypothetical protein